MTDLREIVRDINPDLSEDDVYYYERVIQDATLLNIGYFPRAKAAICQKHGLPEDFFDFLIWASCKDKIYSALIQAEYDDVPKTNRMIRYGLERGYLRIMNKVSYKGVRLPKFYEVMEPLRDLQREFLKLLHPEFVKTNAKTFYRESPMWVKKNIGTSEKLYYNNIIFANRRFTIK